MESKNCLQWLKSDGIDITSLKRSDKKCRICMDKPYILKQESRIHYVCINIGCGFYSLNKNA